MQTNKQKDLYPEAIKEKWHTIQTNDIVNMVSFHDHVP